MHTCIHKVSEIKTIRLSSQFLFIIRAKLCTLVAECHADQAHSVTLFNAITTKVTGLEVRGEGAQGTPGAADVAILASTVRIAPDLAWNQVAVGTLIAIKLHYRGRRIRCGD